MIFRTLPRTIAHARYVTWPNKFNIDIFKINAERGLAKRGKEELGGARRSGAENQPACSCLPWRMLFFFYKLLGGFWDGLGCSPIGSAPAALMAAVAE